MKSIAALILVVVLALSIQALAADCTAETCTSKILVTQSFDTPDCTGNYTLQPSTNYTETCQTYSTGPEFNSSRAFTCSANAGFVTKTYVDSNCASGDSPFLQQSAIGVCVRLSETSSASSWCNAQSVGTPKPLKTALNVSILPQLNDFMCNTTTGCDKSYGTIYLYNAAGCNAANLQYAYPPLFALGSSLAPRLGTCYVNNATTDDYDDRVNSIATCSNGQFVNKNFQNGCGSDAILVDSLALSTDRCYQSNSNQWFIIKCGGSSASTLTTAPFIMVIFLLAFLLF